MHTECTCGPDRPTRLLNRPRPPSSSSNLPLTPEMRCKQRWSGSRRGTSRSVSRSSCGSIAADGADDRLHDRLVFGVGALVVGALPAGREPVVVLGRRADDVPECLKYLDAASRTTDGRAQFDIDPDARRPPACGHAIGSRQGTGIAVPAVGTAPRSAPAGEPADVDSRSRVLPGTRRNNVAAIRRAASHQADDFERQQ